MFNLNKKKIVLFPHMQRWGTGVLVSRAWTTGVSKINVKIYNWPEHLVQFVQMVQLGHLVQLEHLVQL